MFWIEYSCREELKGRICDKEMKQLSLLSSYLDMALFEQNFGGQGERSARLSSRLILSAVSPRRPRRLWFRLFHLGRAKSPVITMLADFVISHVYGENGNVVGSNGDVEIHVMQLICNQLRHIAFPCQLHKAWFVEFLLFQNQWIV